MDKKILELIVCALEYEIEACEGIGETEDANEFKEALDVVNKELEATND